MFATVQTSIAMAHFSLSGGGWGSAILEGFRRNFQQKGIELIIAFKLKTCIGGAIFMKASTFGPLAMPPEIDAPSIPHMVWQISIFPSRTKTLVVQSLQ